MPERIYADATDLTTSNGHADRAMLLSAPRVIPMQCYDGSLAWTWRVGSWRIWVGEELDEPEEREETEDHMDDQSERSARRRWERDGEDVAIHYRGSITDFATDVTDLMDGAEVDALIVELQKKKG